MFQLKIAYWQGERKMEKITFFKNKKQNFLFNFFIIFILGNFIICFFQPLFYLNSISILNNLGISLYILCDVFQRAVVLFYSIFSIVFLCNNLKNKERIIILSIYYIVSIFMFSYFSLYSPFSFFSLKIFGLFGGR